MKRKRIFGLALVLMLSALYAAPAYADVAPPQQPPGASVTSSKSDTKVQMVSENMVMTIEDYQPTAEEQANYAAPFIIGHVDASFTMQNLGDAAESFDVWFPTGAETGMGSVEKVRDFHAWVDGAEAASIGEETTTGKFGAATPWATWPATFPPGQQVTLRVTYDTVATGYQPYGRVAYILETGAGWNGTIGEGTVTVRLPYDVSELNTAINSPDEYNGPQGGSGAPSVSGKDIIWHFTDLEPTEDSNIGLTILAPAVWMGIQAAQANADGNPNLAQAQLDLANALAEGLQFKYELRQIGGSQQLYDRATAAYEKALTLDPNNVDIYTNYLDLLSRAKGPMDIPDNHYLDLLNRAVQLAPGNEQLIGLKQGAEVQLTQGAEMGTVLPPTLEVAQATVVPAATASPTLVPAQATETPIAEFNPGYQATSTMTLIIILLVIGAVVVAAALGIGIWLGRRSKK